MLLDIRAKADEMIVDILSRRQAADAQTLQSLLRQRGRGVSFQAVYKSLRKLQRGGVLVKVGRDYSLKLSWALDLLAFARRVTHKQYGALAPQVAEYTLLIKGVTPIPITSDRLTEYLNGLAKQLAMLVVIPAEAWETKGGRMAAIALDQCSPLVNVWDGPQTTFKVNIDARAPFCIQAAVAYTREFFVDLETAFVAL